MILVNIIQIRDESARRDWTPLLSYKLYVAHQLYAFFLSVSDAGHHFHQTTEKKTTLTTRIPQLAHFPFYSEVQSNIHNVID